MTTPFFEMPTFWDRIEAMTPMGRPGQPAELAPTFVFLASQESSYISGEIIGVTGGKPIS